MWPLPNSTALLLANMPLEIQFVVTLPFFELLKQAACSATLSLSTCRYLFILVLTIMWLTLIVLHSHLWNTSFGKPSLMPLLPSGNRLGTLPCTHTSNLPSPYLDIFMLCCTLLICVSHQTVSSVFSPWHSAII